MLASINIIPFVDIVLVLLVIFMLTSATIVRASLKVELPRAASGGSRVETTLNLVADQERRALGQRRAGLDAGRRRRASCAPRPARTPSCRR